MTDWTAIATAVIGALLGGGGVAAWVRARGQNAVDDRSQLTNEQVAFRKDMAAELAALRVEIANLKAANAKLDDRNDELVRENGDLKGRVRFLEEQNADLKNTVMNERAEKESMKRKIAQLEEQVRGLDRRAAYPQGESQ